MRSPEDQRGEQRKEKKRSWFIVEGETYLVASNTPLTNSGRFGLAMCR